MPDSIDDDPERVIDDGHAPVVGDPGRERHSRPATEPEYPVSGVDS